MIFLSLKTYKEVTGDNAVKLCQTIKKVASETQVPIIPAAQAFDIYRIKKEVDIEVWAQHLDPIDPGRHFGWLSPYAAKQAGATGVVINHLEHEIDFEIIKSVVEKCKQYDLKTLVIVDTVDLAEKVNQLKPDYLAYENAELIGGPVAMIDHDPEGTKQVVKLASMPVIVGAGIKTKEHVQKTIKIGGSGVILASAVVKADDQQAALNELASGFK
ncbi:triose-phosphate isomerase [Patescibacteria group bacterium]